MNFCGRISVFSENIQISKQASQWMVGLVKKFSIRQSQFLCQIQSQWLIFKRIDKSRIYFPK